MTTTKGLIPHEGIVTYKSTEDGNVLYVEKGKFIEFKGEYKLQGLTPFTFAQLKLFNNISGKKGIYLDELIPSNVLYYDGAMHNPIIFWTAPKAIRKILFSEESLTKDYLIPNMLFISDGSNLRVYFIKEKDMKKITMDTKIYQTHFYNVYDDCRVCIGSGYKLGDKSVPLHEYITKVEHNFFEGSSFNHAHTGKDVFPKLWVENNGQYPEKQWKNSNTTTIGLLLSKLKNG
jgi:hypothetical protein